MLGLLLFLGGCPNFQCPSIAFHCNFSRVFGCSCTPSAMLVLSIPHAPCEHQLVTDSPPEYPICPPERNDGRWTWSVPSRPLLTMIKLSNCSCIVELDPHGL